MVQSNADGSKLEVSHKTSVYFVSNLHLTGAEEHLLSKGIKFCPTPLHTDKLLLQKDLDTFKRRLSLFEFVNADCQTGDEEPSRLEVLLFKNKSMWVPREERDKFLECFLKAVRKDVEDFQPLNLLRIICLEEIE
ncbi:hypothetical protein HOLleu_35085 [Holothuria leucospilota]|uniref:Uncharacterized protein n=1 Tax=Holothuria leucospilota TaxID=206669 RepID=A0A9Q0YSS4_HOLLE|nr:hypothetical protein HOLleu_35085 [Holothuria leucospilota]